MKIVVIDWEKKLIEEYETDSIKYEEDGISYTYSFGKNYKTVEKIPYNQFLGVKEN